MSLERFNSQLSIRQGSIHPGLLQKIWAHGRGLVSYPSAPSSLYAPASAEQPGEGRDSQRHREWLFIASLSIGKYQQPACQTPDPPPSHSHPTQTSSAIEPTPPAQRQPA
ncbi:unnamed protein product [Arctogadus glacialis]